MNKKNKKHFSRRDFIKYSSLAGGAISLAGVAGAGYASGKDYSSYTGLNTNNYGKDQFFNRKPFYVETPTYSKVGKTRRIDYLERLFKRNGEMYRLMYPRDGSSPKWDLNMDESPLPQPLKSYYRKHPGALDEFKKAIQKSEEQHQNWEKFKDKYLLADAWSAAHSSPIRGSKSMQAFPAEPEDKPEISDFKGVRREALQLKSKKHGSELIKKIAYSFGATLVGVTKLKHDWVYQGYLRGVGKGNFEVPQHWKNAVVIAVPHEWDSLYANPTYGTSYDGYSRLRFIAGKLEIFLKHIGYSARSHVPPVYYDIAVTPVAIDAGLGEQGRNSTLITPELGANTRLAAVTTDMPLLPDQPIDVGIKDFCNKCKICAETCPSGAISFDEEPKQTVRGYKRWVLDQDKCFTVWNSVATSHPRGCRVCLAVCPYTRKNNWIHTIAREVDPRDPTGLFSSAMIAMQKGFFEYPDAHGFLPPPDGNNKTYHDGPDWLKTEEWFDY